MLHKLTIKNGIKYKNSEFTFEKGLTVIKGKNGNGKSLIQEFIRFALFGSSALRGKVSDYPSDMEIGLLVTIKGKKIDITRTLKDCVIKVDGDVAVRGTTACNTWIIGELGYDLSVFDMGNAAKQFEIDKLGKMKPSERKTAIDQIIGLTAVTKLIKQVKDEKNEVKNYVLGFKDSLVEPELPDAPNNYRESSSIDEELRQKREIKANRDLAEARMKEHECVCPQWSGEIPTGDLKNESLHKFWLEKVKGLNTEGSKYTREELNDWLRASNEWYNYKEPELTEEEINALRNQWLEYRHYSGIKKITCPKCGTVLSIEGEIKEVKEPSLSEEYLKEQTLRHARKPKSEKPEVLIDQEFFNTEIKKIAEKEEYETCTKHLSELGTVDYDALRRYEQYKKEKQEWDLYQYYFEQCKSITNVPTADEIKVLEDSLLESRIYEENLRRYAEERKTYERNFNIVSEKMNRQIDLENAIEALTKFMSIVKNSIIPSLSKVSTELVREMTNGKFNEIKVEEDFSITADGKEICLLSGGEEAVVNLAIRLALSSVLTRKVFNVFIGDEIDQSMDEERAENTADMLSRLSKSQIEQIILITHKDIVGDNLIDI